MTSLATPHMRVTRFGEEPFIVRVLNPDLVKWDRYRASHRWPGADQAPMLWATFVSWSAARRDKAVPDSMDYPEFEETTEQIEMVDEYGNPVGDPSESTEADPTQPGAVPG